MYFAAVKAGPQWVRGAAFSSIPSGQSVSVEELEKLGEELKKHPLSPEELEALAIEN